MISLASTDEGQKRSNILNYAWLVAVVAAFTQFIVVGARQGTGTLLAYIADDLGITLAVAAVIVSSFHLGQVIGGPVWGNLIDRIGLRMTFGAASLACSIMVILFGFFANSLPLACVLMCLIGLGTAGFKDATIPKMVSTWFAPSMRGRGIIPITFGGTIAGVVFGVVIPALLEQFTWNMTYVILGCFDVVVSILVILVVRNDPADLNMVPCGSAPGVKVGAIQADEPAKKPSMLKSLSEGFRLKYAWLLGIICFCGQIFLSGCMNYTVAAVLDKGFDIMAAGLCMSIFSLTMCFSQIILSAMCDKFATKHVMMLMYIGFIVSSVLMWVCYALTSNIFIIYVMCAIAGLFFGQVPVINIQQMSLFPVNLRGSGSGVVAFVGTIGSVAGPLIAGAVIGISGVAYGFVYSCLGAGILAFLLTFLLPKTGGKYGDPFLNADGTVKPLDEVKLKR